MSSLHVSQVQAAKKAQKLVALVFITIIVTIVWASVSTLQESVVGIGTVVPAQAVQAVENLDGGILKKVLVKEGQQVKLNQPLLLLDDTRFAAAFAESNQEKSSLLQKKYRLEQQLRSVKIAVSDPAQQVSMIKQPISDTSFSTQELSNISFSYQSIISQLEARIILSKQAEEQQIQAINEQKDNIKNLKKRLKLLNKELNLTANVVDVGAVSEMELIKLQRIQVEIEGDINRAKSQKLQLESAKQQVIDERINLGYEFLAKTQSELDEVTNNLAKLNESSKALADRLDKTEIRSPVNGTVKNILTRSLGGVIEPGQTIMEIVPLDDQLLIETQISPKDIGFLFKGMPAMVKFTAYDFVIYGGLTGTVVYVGADAQQMEDGTIYYEAHIKTSTNLLANRAIIPGMQASVDILTGQKTVLYYWLKPLLRGKANAMKER